MRKEEKTYYKLKIKAQKMGFNNSKLWKLTGIQKTSLKEFFAGERRLYSDSVDKLLKVLEMTLCNEP